MGYGFSVCTGTAGEAANVILGPSGDIPNAATDRSKAYVSHYNWDPSNAGISKGVPGDTTDSWNTVGYTTAQGCCSREADWGTSGRPPAQASNQYQATRLTPFTTASSVGALDSGNMNPIPADLTGLTKVWGALLQTWMHGGTHANNVGVWNNPGGFTVKYNGDTWNQPDMLWSRMTGDSYNASLDGPNGLTQPAPPGSTFDKLVPDPNPPPTLPGQCKACDVDADSGQIFPSTAPDACTTPYLQHCPFTRALTQSDMGPYGSTSNPNTNVTNGYSDIHGRVGGVFATRDMYGPGRFSILANLPPTAATPGSAIMDASYPWVNPITGEYSASTKPGFVQGGRGYVFAIWTYNYTEAYQAGVEGTSAATSVPFNVGISDTACAASAAGGGAFGAAQGVGTPTISCGLSNMSQYAETVEAAPVGLSNASVTFPDIPGLVSGDAADGFFAVHNHEIDIEIPANSYQNQGTDMMRKMGLDTANLNTWMTDTGNYGDNTQSLYQQVQATAPVGKFFAAVAPGDDENTFHEYTIVWFVDPLYDPTATDAIDNSYVSFALDGNEIYRSRRYIPRRSGRVLIGLWPAWWGSNYEPMAFNQVYAKIARIELVPQAGYKGPLPSLVTNGSQMYDQSFPIPGGGSSTAAEVHCGFETPLPNRTAGPSSGPGPNSGPNSGPSSGPSSGPNSDPSSYKSKKRGLPWWTWLLVAVAAAVLVSCSIWFGVTTAKRRGVLKKAALKLPTRKRLRF